VLREHEKFDGFIGPRMMVHSAYLEMHPLDTEDRTKDLKDSQGIGYCNITKCCTVVCPEHIKITDNAIHPTEGEGRDFYYDPLKKLFQNGDGEENSGTQADRCGRDSARARTRRALPAADEPDQAVSICRDILAVDPGNQEAIAHAPIGPNRSIWLKARSRLGRMRGDRPGIDFGYDKAYYAGWPTSAGPARCLQDQTPKHSRGRMAAAGDGCYQEAEAVRNSGNDDSIFKTYLNVFFIFFLTY